MTFRLGQRGFSLGSRGYSPDEEPVHLVNIPAQPFYGGPAHHPSAVCGCGPRRRRSSTKTILGIALIVRRRIWTGDRQWLLRMADPRVVRRVARGFLWPVCRRRRRVGVRLPRRNGHRVSHRRRRGGTCAKPVGSARNGTKVPPIRWGRKAANAFGLYDCMGMYGSGVTMPGDEMASYREREDGWHGDRWTFADRWHRCNGLGCPTLPLKSDRFPRAAGRFVEHHGRELPLCRPRRGRPDDRWEHRRIPRLSGSRSSK